MKYGCLQVLDNGAEYLKILDSQIASIEAEKIKFVQIVKEGKVACKNQYGWNGEKTIVTLAYVYKPVSFESYKDCVNICDFEKAVLRLAEKKKTKHYKCQCKKCEKIRYYSEETLLTQPKVCYRPMYCASPYRYSSSAQNATYRKRQKYKNNESVDLVQTKDAVIPSEKYCDSWNKKKKKELVKQAEKDAEILAAIPRKLAKNYNKNYVGLIYESYKILECINEGIEDAPIPYYNERHQKKYKDIVVYKEYRCKCYLCGKEKIVRGNQFGIYPPTDYGYRAYNGYWSEIHCDCHQISSFQWIVNDILFKHNIKYQVEVSVEGVYGVDNETPLRFDFGIYGENGIVAFIECQGEQHYKPVEKFGGERAFVIQQRNDEEKRKYARE